MEKEEEYDEEKQVKGIRDKGEGKEDGVRRSRRRRKRSGRRSNEAVREGEGKEVSKTRRMWSRLLRRHNSGTSA